MRNGTETATFFDRYCTHICLPLCTLVTCTHTYPTLVRSSHVHTHAYPHVPSSHVHTFEGSGILGKCGIYVEWLCMSIYAMSPIFVDTCTHTYLHVIHMYSHAHVHAHAHMYLHVITRTFFFPIHACTQKHSSHRHASLGQWRLLQCFWKSYSIFPGCPTSVDAIFWEIDKLALVK